MRCLWEAKPGKYKKYYSVGDDSDIENIYNTSVFDPKEAEDLDRHLEHLAEASGATITEFTAYDVLDWGTFVEE